MSMMYYQTMEWKEICVKKEQEQRLINEVVRSIQTSNAQQLACEAALDNFAINTQPENYTDKLKFPLKQRLKLAKQGARITSVDELRQKLKPECTLDTSCLAVWADDLTTLFSNAIETNPIELLV